MPRRCGSMRDSKASRSPIRAAATRDRSVSESSTATVMEESLVFATRSTRRQWTSECFCPPPQRSQGPQAVTPLLTFDQRIQDSSFEPFGVVEERKDDTGRLIALRIELKRETRPRQDLGQAEALFVNEIGDLASVDVLDTMFQKVPRLPVEFGLDLARRANLLGIGTIHHDLDAPHRRAPASQFAGIRNE